MGEHLIPFTKEQDDRLKLLTDKIRRTEKAMVECSLAYLELWESQLWKSKARSWEQFCEQEFQYSPRRVRQMIQAASFIRGIKTISDTTGEKVKMPHSVNEALKMAKEETSDQVALAPERHSGPDTSAAKIKKDLSAAKEEVEKPPDLPMPFRAFAQFIWDGLDWLTHHVELPILGVKKVQAMLSQADKFRHANVLSGMETIMSSPGTRRPTLDEVKAYCKKVGIPESDAEWFLNKMEGNGWMNGTQPVKNWMGTLSQKRTEGLLGSQIAARQQQKYGQPASQTKAVTLSQKLLNESTAEVDRLMKEYKYE